MRSDAVQLEEMRLSGIRNLEDYPWSKERHRVFPAVFENRNHRRILDTSAGVGCAARRIREGCQAELICNDIAPTCLSILRGLGLQTVSFDLDDHEQAFPFPDQSFDAIISLVTIEHLIHVDHFLRETGRILEDSGYLYLSTPNYAAPEYVKQLLFSGRSFHDPLRSAETYYEFFAHVRYFTYKTMLEYVSSFGFQPEAVYIALPGGSSRFQSLYARSRPLALAFRYGMWLRHMLLSPRWAAEPIVCFRKSDGSRRRQVRKVVL